MSFEFVNFFFLINRLFFLKACNLLHTKRGKKKTLGSNRNEIIYLAYLGVHLETHCKEYKHQILVAMIDLSIYLSTSYKFTESFEVVTKMCIIRTFFIFNL